MVTNLSGEGPKGLALPQEQDSLGAGIIEIWNAFKRRWLSFVLVVSIVVVLAVIATLLISPKYNATLRLRVEPSQNMLVGQPTTGSNMPDQSIVETEASIMKSHDLAAIVVSRLGLINDEEFTKGLDPLPANAAKAQIDQRVDEVADEVAKNVSVSREKATYVVDLSFRSKDPQKAAKVANALAAAYIEQSVSRRTGTAAKQSAMIQARLDGLAAAAQAADERLAQYLAANGIANEGSVSVTEQQISPLAGQVATAESDAAAARSKYAVAQSQVAAGGLTAVSAVLDSQVVSNLRTQRAQLMSQFGEISTRYGPRHPESLRIKEQLDSIDRQIREEANRIVGSLRSEAVASAARAASLRANLNGLRSAQASETRASVSALGYQRAADAAHLAYNQAAELAQRTNQIASAPLSQAQIIEPALAPLDPSSPNKPALLLGGLALGLLLGAAVVAIQEILASGIRTRRQLERIGLPLLASVPLSRRPGARRSPADSIIDAPFTAYAEAFRSIRNTVTISSGQPLKVLALVSSLPGEGKTTTALSLARMMAMSGERTLIIDADARRAGLLNLLPHQPETGLLEVLGEGADLKSALQADVVEGLDILPVSSSAFVQSDVFSRERLAGLLAQIRDQYDRIIFDTPPVLGVADARAIATVVDAVLMVVRWEKTPRNAVRSTLDILFQDNAPVVGGILTMVDPRVEAAGAAYYSTEHSAYYQTA